MSDTDGYNGWTNRATWAVALHVNNDQGWQEQVLELVTSSAPQDYDDEGNDLPKEYDASTVADMIEQNVTAIVDPLAYVEEFGDVSLSAWANGPGMAARDIGDLDDVNWHELAEAFIRDVQEG